MRISDYQKFTQETSLDAKVNPRHRKVIDLIDMLQRLGIFSGELKKYYRDNRELTSYNEISDVIDEFDQAQRNYETYTGIDPEFLYMFLGAFDELMEFFYSLWSGDSDTEKEYGDLNWYISQLGVKARIDQEKACKKNKEKLLDRKKRNVIKGDGDDR